MGMAAGRVRPVRRQVAVTVKTWSKMMERMEVAERVDDRSEDLQIFGSKNLRIGRRLSCPFQS